MSKTVAMNINCPLCKADTKLQFIKPSALQPSITKHYCVPCASRFMFRIIHKPGSVNGVTIETTVMEMGDAIKSKIEMANEARKKTAADRAKKAMEGLKTEGGAP